MFSSKLFVSCLVAVLVSTVSVEASRRIGTVRISGGNVITIDQAPYMVQFREDTVETYCGGTLITPKHIITAAHCLYNTEMEKVIVVGGASTRSEDGVQRRIAKVTIHPDYNPDTMHTDIAVVELKEPMEGENIKTMPLCENKLKEGDFVQVSGWGQLTLENEDMPEQLRTVRLPVRSSEVCAKEFGRYVKKNMFCASGFEKKGFCLGDSGGPAVYRGQLCGIVAFVNKCGVVGRLSAFTDVHDLLSFINKAIGK